MAAHAGAVHDLDQVDDAGDLGAGDVVDAVDLSGLHQSAAGDGQGTSLLGVDDHAAGLGELLSGTLLSRGLSRGGVLHRVAGTGSDLLTQLLAGVDVVLQAVQFVQQVAGLGFQSGEVVAGSGVDLGVDSGQAGLDFVDTFSHN